MIIWCMVPEISSATDKIFCHFGQYFAHLPPKNLKNEFFLKKWKKTPGDIIILTKCTKNQHHMLYCYWDMTHVKGNCYFSFWTIFCPFTPLTAQKMKISKKWKEHLEMSLFHTSVPKIMIICYTVPETWPMMDVIIFHLGPFFALLPL